MVSLAERPHLYSFSLNEIRYVFSVSDPATDGCAVEIELYYHAITGTIGILFKSFTLIPTADGNINCIINDYLHSLLKPELPVIAGATIQPVSDQVKYFYIRYRQITTATPEPAWISDEQNKKMVLLGGVEQRVFRRNNFFISYLPANKPFLTWQPANRFVFANEKHYLTYLQTGGFDFSVNVRTVFSDGTTNETLINHAVGNNRLFRIKAGANDLGLNLIDPTKQLYYYEISVIRTLGGAVLVNPYRFYLEYRHMYNYTDIIYFNSLGGLDSVRIKGEVSWEIENSGNDVEHITGNDAFDTDRPQQQFSQVNQLKKDNYKGDAGWSRTPAQQEALVELLLSRGRFEIVDGRWIGIVNLKKNLALRLTSDKKWSYPVEWSYGFADPVFTPKHIILGAGTQEVVVQPTPPPAGCIAVALPSVIALPDGVVGQAYNYTFTLSGTAPFVLSNVVAPAGILVSITGSDVTIEGTPTTAANNVTISFTVTNCSTDIVNFSDTINIAAGTKAARFGNTTFVFSDASSDVEVANIEGSAGVSVTVRLVEYTNDNDSGVLSVNNTQAFLANEWIIVLSSGGLGSFDVRIDGNPAHTGTHVRGKFQIVAVSSGTIALENTFLISKIF